MIKNKLKKKKPDDGVVDINNIFSISNIVPKDYVDYPMVMAFNGSFTEIAEKYVQEANLDEFIDFYFDSLIESFKKLSHSFNQKQYVEHCRVIDEIDCKARGEEIFCDELLKFVGEEVFKDEAKV